MCTCINNKVWCIQVYNWDIVQDYGVCVCACLCCWTHWESVFAAFIVVSVVIVAVGVVVISTFVPLIRLFVIIIKNIISHNLSISEFLKSEVGIFFFLPFSLSRISFFFFFFKKTKNAIVFVISYSCIFMCCMFISMWTFVSDQVDLLNNRN